MDYHSIHHQLHGSSDLVAPPPVRSASLTMTTAMTGVNAVASDNPVVSSAMQVLDQLSDVGKALPFVSPAFVILKIILDMERRASDVDAKCNDLVERITFMLGHMPILLKIDVMPATRNVVERINETLKEAAALIAAYRKQGKIARRLSIGNREKFVTCADSVNSCCRDLLMSLQIQQSVKLDILTRKVPLDEDDEAAETFVAAHGGSIDAVVHDRELVKEFAQQRHLTMDDAVMEQLNTNIADSVKANHERLEGVLRDNVQASIVDGLKSLAAEMLSAEAEQKFTCVQCDAQFTHYTNGPKACSFHRAEYNSWSKQYPCCSASAPCEFGVHRSKHHCDYPYATFFPRSRGILNYIDTKEEWCSVEDANLETNDVQQCSVSQLLRWASRGARLEENTLLITVGSVWYNEPYYFNTFTAKEMQEITRSVRLTRRTLIFRTTENEKEYAQADWILSISGKITGVRLAAKSATSQTPYVSVCPIDILTCTRSGDILTLSEGGLRSFTPAGTYTIPPDVRVGTVLSSTESARKPRTNFKTRTSSPSFRVILRASSDPPLAANPQWVRTDLDYFRGTVSVFNNHTPGSLNPISIAAVKASYRLVGEDDYKPVDKCTLLENVVLPLTIEPRQASLLSFEVAVPRTPEDVDRDVNWSYRPFCARHRPLRLRIELEEISGEEASIVFEYVFNPYKVENRAEKDLGFAFYDDADLFERHALHITPGDREEQAIAVEGNMLDTKRLTQVVYQALKSGKTEVDLNIGTEDRGSHYSPWSWKAYGLVDISCRRVYALKIVMFDAEKAKRRRFGSISYVPVPSYGKPSEEVRPIAYATELVKLPPLEDFTLVEYPQDDDIDDYKPPVPPKPATPSLTSPIAPNGVNGSHSVIPVELTERLTSIDVSLARIADALEKLVAVLPTGR